MANQAQGWGVGDLAYKLVPGRKGTRAAAGSLLQWYRGKWV